MSRWHLSEIYTGNTLILMTHVTDGGLRLARGPFGRPVITQAFPEMIVQGAGRQIARLRDANAARLDLQARLAAPLGYFILVPTLRCNLACDYCQVSRVAENAKGFDWSPEVFDATLAMILRSPLEAPVLEFQGGEPLLRLHLIKALREAVIAAGKKPKIVICTNLQVVSDEAWAFFAATDVLISSSFDATWADHDRHRTMSSTHLADFRANLERAIRVLGWDRLSLTSTLDPADPPAPEQVFAQAQELGLRSLFVRPINYQGFARKAYKAARDEDGWDAYYIRFIRELIAYNLHAEYILNEYYFGYLLRRVLDPRRAEHVDLRNPNPLGCDYLVIGEQGDIFPTDEARMLYRIGQIDMRIGHVQQGLDQAKIADMNMHCDNRDDPTCRDCVYQAVCGRDLIDDVSRYGRIDGPRHETRHCRRHMALFDFIMELLAYSNDAELAVLAAMAGLQGLDASAYRGRNV